MELFLSGAREVGRLLFVLLLASFILFSLIYFSPYAGYREQGPWIGEYLVWLENILLKGDLGETKYGYPILPVILERGKASALLISLALGASLLFTSVFWGLFFKIRKIIALSFVTSLYIISSIPVFLGSYLLVFLYPGLIYPSGGREMESPSGSLFWYYLIPAIILGIGDGFLVEMIRHSKQEIKQVSAENYVRMAKAKGTSMWKAIKNDLIIHSLRVIISRASFLLSGTVIVEYTFGLPGLGSVAFNAAEGRDSTFILAILIIMVLCVCVFNFIQRMTAIILDPRLREG